MPIPKPKSGEREDDFISRCIEAIYDEYGQEQSIAICYSTYRESKMSSQERMLNKMNKTQQELEGACWENYIQIGMKPGKGGKMVPNCVGPVKD